MKIIAALVFALALPSCSSLQNVPAPASSTTADALTTAEKVLTAAHKGYDATGVILVAAAKAGVLKGADAAKARAFYDKAGDALLVADTADKAANAKGIAEAIANAQDAIAQATALIK